MRILVCGNRAEHEWPESCVRALERGGHEVRLTYYRSPQPGELGGYLPAAMRADTATLLQSPAGTEALMEVIFYYVAAEFRPDLILLAGIYNTWSSDALADVQDSLGIPVVLWSGDNPYVPHAPDIFSRSAYYELVLFGNFRFAERASDSFARTAYMPFGCDPEHDRAPTADVDLEPYACDLSYLGTLKNERCAFLEALAQLDLELKVWAVGFPRDLAQRFPALSAARQTEHIQGADKTRVYAAAKIVLNLHHTGFANMKLYEAAACGAFQISNKRLEAESTRHVLPLCDEVVTYEHAGELVELLRHYLAHPEQRAARAARLQAEVLAKHTWDQRLSSVLDMLPPAHSALSVRPLR